MMTEYQRLYCRERSRFRRKLRLCDHCGKEPAIEGRVLGVNCQKRQADNYRRKVIYIVDDIPRFDLNSYEPVKDK